MSKFLSPLSVTLITGASNSGRGLWAVAKPFIYSSELIGTVCVPEGFVTDFASVPRLPVAFYLCGDTAHQAAVIHDYLYAGRGFSRAICDDVLAEAMAVLDVPGWRRKAIYYAVRMFGGKFFKG